MTDHLKACEYRARCYVQGSAFHDKLKSVQPLSGRWSQHFANHPRVLEAERDGWGRELRSACVAECKARLFAGQDLGDPDDLMPTRKEWWEATRKNAARYRAGMEFQNAEPDRRQAGRGAAKALTSLSRRMTGDEL